MVSICEHHLPLPYRLKNAICEKCFLDVKQAAQALALQPFEQVNHRLSFLVIFLTRKVHRRHLGIQLGIAPFPAQESTKIVL